MLVVKLVHPESRTVLVQDVAAPLPVVLTEQSSGQTTRYLYGLDPSAGSGQVLEAREQAAWQYYHPDGLGSVRAVTDLDGLEVARYDYYAFGELRAASGSLDEWRFTGEQWDAAAGLQFLRARYYEPDTGRFVSEDPFPGYAHWSQTQNRYVYARNNPVYFADPSGLAPGPPPPAWPLSIALLFAPPPYPWLPSATVGQAISFWDWVYESVRKPCQGWYNGIVSPSTPAEEELPCTP